MKKKQIMKRGLEEIGQQKKAHQDVYDDIKSEGVQNLEEVAETLARIPSTGQMEKTKVLRSVFMIAAIVLGLLRIASLLFLGTAGTLPPAALLFIGIIALLVPGMAIYASIKGNPDLFKTVAILLIVSVVRSLRSIELDASGLISFGLIGLVIFLAFFIPYKMKTPFQKVVRTKTVDGKSQNYYDFVFDDTRVKSEEVLDADV